MDEHQQQVKDNIRILGERKDLAQMSLEWMLAVGTAGKYSYNFSWLGRPIIQYPQDIVMMQELVWQVQPDLIIETGIAHGGSLILSASLLALLDYKDAVEQGAVLDPKSSKRKVIGIDIDIRPHNRTAIDAHPMAHMIQMFQGSSVAPDIVSKVYAAAAGYKRVLVCLDSNHTHDHVLAELEAYASLVSSGSYCIVYDTVIEDTPDHLCADRPWKRGNSPKTAVLEYLGKNSDFEVEQSIEHKLQITVAPGGFLRRK